MNVVISIDHVAFEASFFYAMLGSRFELAIMSETSLRYQIHKQVASLMPIPIPRPTPHSDEVCIRPKAFGLNGLDWKIQHFGVTVKSWPIVAGMDVGENVKDFKPGDEVIVISANRIVTEGLKRLSRARSVSLLRNLHR